MSIGFFALSPFTRGEGKREYVSAICDGPGFATEEKWAKIKSGPCDPLLFVCPGTDPGA